MFAGQQDMRPSKRRDARQELRENAEFVALDLRDTIAEVRHVPVSNDVGKEVQVRYAEMPTLQCHLALSRNRPGHGRDHVPNPRLRHVLIGYARVSKTDGSQSLDLQRDALRAAGVDPQHVYDDFASGVRDDRPGLENCLRALRKDDVLVVWKLDRLGRNLAHLVNTVQGLSARGVGLRVLTGQGAQIDTTTAAGRLVFGIFAALAEFEGDLIRERTMAGLKAARARGRKGGRKFALSKAQVRLAQAAMANRDTSVSELCTELGIKPVTLYRYVDPQGELREQGRKVLLGR